MAGVIPLMAVLYHRRTTDAEATQRPGFRQLVPLFVIGFLAMTLVRSAGEIGDRPFGVLDPEAWDGLIATIKTTAGWALAIAMAAVGLNTSLTRLKGLGWKPCAVGLIAAVLVGLVSFTLIQVMSGFLG